MIPHKLQLKNFLSYGPQLQTIDFSNHSLICLSGKNGHGKSALLDAMTWAVWGQARKVIGAAKPDQGLLRLGQTQMMVIFDFEFNSIIYRIRREYTESAGKAFSVLEFGNINPETQEFIPLTDKTIRATQAKIEQTLRLDFDSFTNSAFLRQGNSNEFSKKAPKDRKSILASILGLDQYEAIRKQALEKIKDATHKKTSLTMLQEKRNAELHTQEELHAQCNTLEQEMNNIAIQEKTWHENSTQLKKIKTALDAAQQQHAMILFQLQQLENNKQEHIRKLMEVRSVWRTVNIKKQNLHNIQLLEQQKKDILTHIADYQKQVQLHLEQKQELLRITHEIHTIEQANKNIISQKHHTILLELERLAAEHDNKQKIITLIEDEYKKNELHYAALSQEITVLTHNNTTCTISTAYIQQEENRLEKRKNSYQSFVSQGNWINNELKNLTQKKNLIHVDDPSCPLCEQNLSASRRRLLVTNFNKQESFLHHRLNRLKRIIPLIKESLLTQHEHLQKNKELLNTKQHNETKLKELQNTQDKIALSSIEITQKITILQNDCVQLTDTVTAKRKEMELISQNNMLDNNQSYQALLQSKSVLDRAVHNYTYNPETYAHKQTELLTLEQQLSEYQYVQQEVAQQKKRLEDIHQLCVVIKQLKQNIEQINKNKEQYNDLPTRIAALGEQEQQHQTIFTEINSKKELLLHTKGSLETEQKRLKKIKLEYEQEQHIIAQLNIVIDDYQIICSATGKDGIQALLIEEAIPEIEQEANILLSQLTNNQAHIFIESLRDLKKGGTKETLDIKISDQNGIRPYELFSGGEAFRIDFALRIAISKLLARRSGTALQTLIIDEGFGSQDDEGLSYIMDALHTIQNNFSKIIVVSHLPAMKDQFPVQFVIQKGVQGSTITVVEQG